MMGGLSSEVKAINGQRDPQSLASGLKGLSEKALRHRTIRQATKLLFAALNAPWHRLRRKVRQAKLKTLPVGSVYTEPNNEPHFAMTADEPVVVLRPTRFTKIRPTIRRGNN